MVSAWEQYKAQLEKAPAMVLDAFMKADSVINNPKYEKGKIECSVSGGADSDVMLDLLWRVDVDKKIRYVFFNTGVEYRATLEHLTELEKKYGIQIERIKPVKPIPVCAKEHGQPVISKFVSKMIGDLQKKGFCWEDAPLEELQRKYPHIPKSRLQWWCNAYMMKSGRKMADCQYNIARNKWLKEYLIEHPPTFNVSASCCTYAKKKPAHIFVKGNGIKLYCVGIRKAEGGIRSAAYTNCYSQGTKDGVDAYRPLFWFTDGDKEEYCKIFGVTHSRCYTEYGFKRTGCAGCPYGRGIEDELHRIDTHEPQMVKMARTVFKDAYEWTRGYRQFCEMKDKGFSQINIDEYL